MVFRVHQCVYIYIVHVMQEFPCFWGQSGDIEIGVAALEFS